MKKILPLIVIALICLKANSQCTIADQTVTATQTKFCPSGGSTTITTGSSETGLSYYLINNANNAIIDGPVAGTGTGISLNTGTITTTTIYNIRAAKPSGGLKFDGVNQYVSVPLSNSPLTNYTYEVWFKTTDQQARISSMRSPDLGSDHDRSLYLENGNITHYLFNTEFIASSGQNYADGKWHFVAVVLKSGVGQKIYMDGTLVASGVKGESDYTWGTFLDIGYAGAYFSGQLDEIKLWNYAKTPAEIHTDMSLCATGTETALLLSYNFEDGTGSSILSDKTANANNGTLYNFNTATDWVGGIENCSSCTMLMTTTATVTIEDVTAPVADVTTLADITGVCSVTVSTKPTATDNCAGSLTATTPDPLTYTTQGTFTINWTYNDLNGNTSTQTQKVIVKDVTAPVADVVTLADITGVCSVTVSTKPTATDNCAGAIVGITTDPLTYTLQGNYIITWTYADGNGNTSTQSQNILVKDVTAPVADISSLPDVTGECTATASLPTASDNCAGSVTGVTVNPKTYTAQGNYTINWIYDDGNGNTSTQTQNVIIKDVTSPVVDVANLVDITGVCAVTVLSTPTATDNCAGKITGATSDALTYNTVGTHVITWTYDDGNGTTPTTQTQKIIVSAVDTSLSITGVTITANAIGATYEWIDCGSNTVIAGETSQSFTATSSGLYALQITENGCIGRSACYNIISTGIAKAAIKYDVSVYPNPTSGLVTIDLHGIVSGKIVVKDIVGRVLISQEIQAQQMAVDLSIFANGMFFVTIGTPSSSQLFKIIKN